MSSDKENSGNYLGFFEAGAGFNRNVILDDGACVRVLNRVIDWMVHRSSRSVASFPKIMTWETYLTENYYRLALDGYAGAQNEFVLSSRQEQALWQIIARDHISVDWSTSVQIGQELRIAWRTLNLWILDFSRSDAVISSGWERFREIAESYGSKLNQIGAQDSSRLLKNSLGERHSAGVLAHGFFSPAPILRAWLKKHAENDDRQAKKSEVCQYHRYPSRTAEIESALIWANKISLADPSSKIAVVLDVSPSESMIVRSLCQEIIQKEFYFSNLSSLIEKPCIKLAIALLEIKDVPRWDDLSLIINHPLLNGSKEESTERALLDFELRSEGRFEWPLKSVIEILKSSDRCPILTALLTEICKSNGVAAKKDSIVNWVSFFRKRLKSLKWLEDANKKLIDKELLNDFASVLDRVTDLDAVLGLISSSEAVWYLRNALAAQRVVYSGGPTNIFVVDGKEALTVDPTHLWLTECTMDKPSLPDETARLLPFSEQRVAGVPGSNPANDFHFRKVFLGLLTSGRKELNVSFAQEEKGVGCFPSPFIPELSTVAVSARKLSSGRPIFNPVTVELFSDDLGSKAEANRPLTGGVSVLEAQAACPFKAFARHRLRSVPIEEVTPGISRKVRGTEVHKALATLWERIKQHARLVELESSELLRLARIAIESNRKKLTNMTSTEIACRSVEESRLLKLLLVWLESEKENEPFMISKIEERLVVDLSGLIFNCRIDRADILSDGSLRILDYKTGRCSLAELAPPRIDAPQLLIYAIQPTLGKISKVALGKVDMMNSRLLQRDMAEHDTRYPDWQADLSELANELKEGLATVNPKRGDATCVSCDQQLFCRIKSDAVNYRDCDG